MRFMSVLIVVYGVDISVIGYVLECCLFVDIGKRA